MNVKTARFLAVFSALFVFGCVNNSPQTGEYALRQVIDGDTIELENGQMVRYIGIDTPEMRKYQDGVWVYSPDPYAQEAKEFNRQLVEGKSIRLEFDIQKQDKYNRLLAYCFADGVFVNAGILEEGLGLLYTSSPNVKYADTLYRSQQAARDNSRGLWAELPVIPAKGAKDYLGRVVTVEGRVSSVYQSKKVTILKFGRSKFKAVIFKNDLPVLISFGMDINKDYKGKVLRITGKIKEYKDDFEIIIRHPSAIEVLE